MGRGGKEEGRRRRRRRRSIIRGLESIIQSNESVPFPATFNLKS